MSIREIREKKGLTLQAMAAQVGVHFTTWARWERDGIPPAKILVVEAATGIPREELCPQLYRQKDDQLPRDAA